MNAETLENCSSTDLRNAQCVSCFLNLKQKRIRDILKTRCKDAVEDSFQAYSRSSSRCSGRSRQSRKSVDFSATKSNVRRSQSLINLREDASSSCVESISQRYRKTYEDCQFCVGRHDPMENSDEEDNATEKSVSLSTSLSNVTYSKAQESETRSKQYQKLTQAVKRLSSVIKATRGGQTTSYSGIGSKSSSATLLETPIKRLYEKDSILKLSKMLDKLTKHVQKHVSSLVVTRKKEKTGLEDYRNNNAILKQRLKNSIIIQKNLEGELKELNKEKKLLEVENKNLAMKIVPLLKESSGSLRRDRSFYRQTAVDDDRKNNNSIVMGSESGLRKSYASNPAAQKSKSLYFCSRKSSVTRWYTNEDEEVTTPISQSVSDSNLTVTSSITQEDISRAEEIIRRDGKRRNQSNDGLDSIASYVRWKSVDFERMHGKLHQNFEELQELKQTLSWLSQEKSEILADLEDLVESYRELERERDNYESILKMILKEKNSSESNIRELLDGLLVHLNNSTQKSSSYHTCQQQHHSSVFCCSDSSHQHHQCSNSRSFLESALNVIQEQNISIREEMTRLRESLQTTTGQNTLLQANNDTLMEKMNDLQRQMETKEVEAEQKEKNHKEKFEQLDQLYKTIAAAKDELETKLQEKEKEIAALNLKNVTEASEKALKDQTEKMSELKDANAKLEKELARLRANNEKLSQNFKQLQQHQREQKGKLKEQVSIMQTDLRKSKDQCNWLQGQIEKFKDQLKQAQDKIQLQEKDKAVLAHKILAAEEERKTLDRNVQEIRTVMEADKLYQKALSERNEVLQLEVNRLRTERLSGDSLHETVPKSPEAGAAKKNKEEGDDSGEKKNIESVKTAIKTVKSKPFSKPGTSVNSRPRPATAKVAGKYSQKTSGRPFIAKATPTCNVRQRADAARRLSRALTPSCTACARPAFREYAPRVKTAASSGPQDSTLKPSRSEERRSVVSSPTIETKHHENSLHCTSGSRPMVALVHVKRRPLIIK